MQPWRVALLLATIAALTSGIIVLAYSALNPPLPKGTQELPYLFHVAEHPGVDVGTDLFRLGALTPGGVATRTFSAADPLSDTMTRFAVSAIGPGSEWFSFEPQVLALPGTVTVTLHVPEDADYDTYEGVIALVPIYGAVN